MIGSLRDSNSNIVLSRDLILRDSVFIYEATERYLFNASLFSLLSVSLVLIFVPSHIGT